MPTGLLAAAPLWARLVACAIALVVFFAGGRNLLAGIAAGFLSLVGVLALS